MAKTLGLKERGVTVRSMCAAILVLLAGPCPAQEASAAWGRPLNGPLTPSLLTTSHFLVMTDLWAATVGPDTLTFCPDGTSRNRRAGLAGTWRMEGDTAVWIAERLFTLRPGHGDLFAPIREGATIGWYVRRAAVSRPGPDCSRP
jgi:hypothetical protein